MENDLRRNNLHRHGTVIKGHHDPDDLVDKFKIDLDSIKAEKKESHIMPVVIISFIDLFLVFL